MKKLLVIIVLTLILFISSCTKQSTSIMTSNRTSNNNTTKTTNMTSKKTSTTKNLIEIKRAADFGYLNYDKKFLSTPFYSDNFDAITYLMNALWNDFGVNSGGKVYQIGNCSSWFNIDAYKTMWIDNDIKGRVKNYIRDYPQKADGYIWSWNTSETWGGPGYSDTVPYFNQSYHFDQMFEYINAIKEIIVWEGSTDYLYEKDFTRAQTENLISVQGSGKYYNYEDASYGKTVLQKMELVINYMLNELNGSNGLIIIDKYFNTGDYDSSSTNIWDTLCFGYKDPYEGALFLGSLNSMIEIYHMLNDTEKVEAYTNLLERAYEAYDETYWDNEKGRYVSTISKSGVTYDYGLTFLQFMALFHGAGNSEKARIVFDWIDGVRTIDSDTVTGKTIMDMWKISAMTNTVSIESKYSYNEHDQQVGWFHAPNFISCFTNATYLNMLENGGTIFYTAFYEMMSRIKHGMLSDSLTRLLMIADEYKKDELDRDPPNNLGIAWMIGVIEEFPENGLVPLIYSRGFMGVNAKWDGLHIEPSIPEEYINMGCKSISYKGMVLDINIINNEKIVIKNNKGGVECSYIFSDFLGSGNYNATVTYKDGTSKTIPLVKNQDNTYTLNIDSNYKEVVVK